jgi:hypothetical protein
MLVSKLLKLPLKWNYISKKLEFEASPPIFISLKTLNNVDFNID